MAENGYVGWVVSLKSRAAWSTPSVPFYPPFYCHGAHPSGVQFFFKKGVNDESSFEADLLKRAPGCQVWGYDFTTKGVRSER